MYNYKSFSSEAFYEALQKKDYTRLKVNAVSAIRNNPTFAKDNDEFTQLIKDLDNATPEIFEDERKLGYEQDLSEENWDTDYFVRLTSYFQDNFAKSRIPKIKEVGRKVYKQETIQKNNQEPIQGDNRKKKIETRSKPTTAPRQTNTHIVRNIMIAAAAVAGAIALVLLIIKIFK